MSYAYDDQNIFAKILRGEIPNTTVAESEHTLAFKDINPVAPVHVLVVPKGPYVNIDHFGADASAPEIADFWRTVSDVARKTGVARVAGGEGFRTIANTDIHGVQDVPHFHVHILGGRQLGRMMPRDE
ncbi:MAG: HIT domain-containing protein [Pseudomonadota bacterium]